MQLQLRESLDWLDSKPPWKFLAVFYVARWVLLVPYLLVAGFLFTDAQLAAASARHLSAQSALFSFPMIVIVGPVLETLLECSLPFFILSLLHRKKGKLPARPWLFVFISAGLMVLSHPFLAAVFPAFITGLFLAYCYAHFATRGFGQALFATSLFHGAINIVGWSIIVLPNIL